MILINLLLTLLSLILYAILTTKKPKNYPPGPLWLPILGSSGMLQQMAKKHGSEFRAFCELSTLYSTKVLGMRTSTELVVVVFGEKNVRQVFNDKEFDARPHNFFAKLRCLGKTNVGITFANGEIWKQQRQFAVKMLKNVGYGKSPMDTEIQLELSRILEYIKDNTSKPINLMDVLSQCIMNVLWSYVAGESIPENKLKHLLNLFRQRNKAFSVGGGILNQIPWCRFVAPEFSGYKLITKMNEEIAQIIEEVIQKHKSKEIVRNDFIYLYLQEILSQKNPTFTEDQLKVVCLDLLIAGSQTSSNVLSFSLLRALISQDIQEKIYNEIKTLIGERMPCWEDNDRFVYTSAFIQEIYRYYMVVPLGGPRLAQSDTWIDGYLVPKGTTVLISLGDIYRDPTLFAEPNEFKPERFIDKNGMLKTSSHLYHFGLGRRRCPGDSLAKSFVFIFLVGILQKFRIQCTNGTVPTDNPIIGILSSPKPYTAEFSSRVIDNRSS